MANEISCNLTLQVTKNGATLAQNISRTLTMTGDEMVQNVQIIGTSNEALTLNDISGLGCIFLRNLDAANYVEIALDAGTTQVISKLEAGDFILLKEPATLYARANTAACKLLVFAIEK